MKYNGTVGLSGKSIISNEDRINNQMIPYLNLINDPNKSLKIDELETVKNNVEGIKKEIKLLEDKKDNNKFTVVTKKN